MPGVSQNTIDREWAGIAGTKWAGILPPCGGPMAGVWCGGGERGDSARKYIQFPSGHQRGLASLVKFDDSLIGPICRVSVADEGFSLHAAPFRAV